MSAHKPTVYADLRCLQDPGYQYRGVGHHVSSLLRGRPDGPARDWPLVGLLDPQLPPLPAEYRALCDEVTHCLNPVLSHAGALFLDASPMTHDPRFSLRLAGHAHLLGVAVIYDFIPLDWPGYFPALSHRMDYLSKVVRLKGLDLFFPISHYSARRLMDLLAVPESRVTVTGAAVRAALYEACAARTPPPGDVETPYFLTVGGGDRRKNTEVAIRAVRRLNLVRSTPVELRVVGHYGPDYAAELRQLAREGPGFRFLQFCPGVSDGELTGLYTRAVATIAPSHIEGFSLPIVEAALCGSPVIASSCAAQMELVGNPDATFPSDRDDILAERLERVMDDRSFRAALVREQADLAPRYHEQAVAERFWTRLARDSHARFGNGNAPAVGRAVKPALAVLSPYPPDASGIARFTERTFEAAAGSFQIDLYSDAPRPLLTHGACRDAGRIGPAALLGKNYDAVIAVLGNSHFHTPIFELFERYGGPCILHDSRLTHIYHRRLGAEGFQAFASRLLGRAVSSGEVEVWLQDKDLPSLFVEPVLERARPLIVHTHQFQALLKERYGAHASVATFPPNLSFPRDEIRPRAREEVRRSLGLATDRFVVATFGYVGVSKGVFACIVALEILRSWGIPAELYFVGDPAGLEGALNHVAVQYGVRDHVHWDTGFVEDARYRNFMAAADAAIQLRSYGFGQPSAALADCISAGLPAVASNELALSCDAPPYIERVPDHTSPLLVAEGLARIWERSRDREAHEEQRQEYLRQHSFAVYARRLREILELT